MAAGSAQPPPWLPLTWEVRIALNQILRVAFVLLFD